MDRILHRGTFLFVSLESIWQQTLDVELLYKQIMTPDLFHDFIERSAVVDSLERLFLWDKQWKGWVISSVFLLDLFGTMLSKDGNTSRLSSRQ